jgi:adenylate kinase
MEPITVLFFGTQGAGKGTQVKMLMEFLTKNSENGLIHIDMGGELRTMIAEGSYSSPLVQNVLNQGARMPDFMPTYLQTKKIVENLKTGKEHIIADGLARGADQTRAFDDMMSFYNRKNFQVIYLTLSEESSVKRLLARGRVDDTEEAIRKRLAWSQTDMMPQLDLLKSRGRTVHEIDGEPDVEAIHKNILSVLGLA